ncbi:hypothetical protein ACIQ6Y_15460 [Streptomyces sp. NPDC096205]|uniref:hypothetical protein n=1 Tax=Streptomyces sp. NPDC096205 TaxID=3366081 RepID=UPI00382F10AB
MKVWKERTANYTLGMQWLLSGWRVWAFIPFYLLLLAAGLWNAQLPPVLEEKLGTEPANFIAIVVANAGAIWAICLKGREVRRGKERMKVVDEYLAIREERMAIEFSDLCDRFLEEQERWRSETMASLYEQILDQVERDVLKPREYPREAD